MQGYSHLKRRLPLLVGRNGLYTSLRDVPGGYGRLCLYVLRLPGRELDLQDAHVPQTIEEWCTFNRYELFTRKGNV